MNRFTDYRGYQSRIFTLPNLLSFFRICLIPLIIHLYLGKENYTLTAIFVLISGLTDVADGFIARKFGMTSDLGKVLDPLADKATQLVLIVLLSIRFPLMILPLSAGIIKEVFMAVSGWLIVKRREVVLGAEWHGKLATFILTLTSLAHLLPSAITPLSSALSITASTLLILLSLLLYARRNLGYLRGVWG